MVGNELSFSGFLVRTVCCAIAIGCGLLRTQAAPSPSIARVWNEEILAAIRIDLPHPPVHARNLFHLSAARYGPCAFLSSLRMVTERMNPKIS